MRCGGARVVRATITQRTALRARLGWGHAWDAYGARGAARARLADPAGAQCHAALSSSSAPRIPPRPRPHALSSGAWTAGAALTPIGAIPRTAGRCPCGSGGTRLEWYVTESFSLVPAAVSTPRPCERRDVEGEGGERRGCERVSILFGYWSSDTSGRLRRRF
ncbi:hypothetical protein B0H15DRAFT_564955 [Mycena belliarum]|uniref:Uncharacterized protein n=1 Tax=Mycena belliarum TaxID=1033014 RepID=A0AAD6TRZ9_9AGAR|nr:hypothetical protein B0H15DRAFT_564955 [Mycena belliae]